MKIIVLIKEVPDMRHVKFDSERGVVDRSSAGTEMNPFDESALQTAIDLVGSCGGEVVCLTMGPPRAEGTLRDAYARGADELVLLSDPAFAGADSLATARTLARAIDKMGFDLIIAGEKTVDGDTAQVPFEVAEMLGVPSAPYVDCVDPKISADDGCLQVAVEEMAGKRQVRLLQMPCLISVSKNAAKLRLPTINRKLESLDAKVTVMTLSNLGEANTADDVGLKGSATKVRKITIPQAEQRSLHMMNSAGELAAVLKQCSGVKRGFGDE